jgi:pyruvate dehydrogenase (quinone)
MKAAHVITEMLHSVGVRRIFGVVGDSLYGITESLRKRGDID